LDCGSQPTILIPLSFDGLTLTSCERVFLLTSRYTCKLCPMFFLDSLSFTSHVLAPALSAHSDDAFVLLIYFCVFNLYEPLQRSQSVDHLNSKIYTICRASTVTPSSCLPQKQFMKRDTGSRLYCLSSLLSTGIVTCISYAFSARSFPVQILRTSSRRHSVLMLLSLSSVTHSILLFGLFVACKLSYRCLQME